MAPAKTTPKKAAPSSQGGLGEVYFSLLRDYPRVTLTTQAIVIACLASITTEHFLHQRFPSPLDFTIQAVVQGLYITPLIGAFVSFLQSQKQLSTLTKLVIDQLVFSPCFTFGIILICELIVAYATDRHKFRDPTDVRTIRLIATAVLGKTVAAQKAAWLFWIPQRAFSMNYVPDILTLPFNTFCSYFWTCLFMWVLSRA